MKITEKAWTEYIDRLARLNETAGQKMAEYIEKHGTADTETLISYAYALVQKYGEGSAELACQMYDSMALLSAADVPPAEPAAPASRREVEGMVKANQAIPPHLLLGVSRFVKLAASDTTLKNASRDGAEFAWVPHGDTCAFCIMLASNGWKKAGRKTKRGTHAQHIHAHCNCEYAVRFDDSTSVAGYDPDRYLAQYADADGDLNAIRREHYAKHKDLINAQKRAAYAKRRALQAKRIEDAQREHEQKRIAYALRQKQNLDITNGAHQMDFMGRPKTFVFKDRRGKTVYTKGYEVDGHEGIFSQTNSLDARNTITLIEEAKEHIPQLKSVKGIIVKKDLGGVAAYEHKTHFLYVDEKISNPEFVRNEIANGYFVAENAEEALMHEMHHKDHHDLIDRKMLTSHKDRATVKQEIEADLRAYVMRQCSSQYDYVSVMVSDNAANGLKLYNSLNELIAEVLLQNDKGIVQDRFLMEKVGDMFHDGFDVE